MKLYNLKVKPASRAFTKEEFLKIKELGKVTTVLKKYGLDDKARNAIQTTRKAIKTHGYNIELTRQFGRETLKLNNHITDRHNVYPTIIQMRNDLVNMIKKKRSERARKYTNADGKLYYNTREVRLQNNVIVRKQGKIYIESGVFMKIYKRKLREDIFKSKNPKTETEDYVGVELEFSSKKDREFIADTLFDAGLAPHISIKGDGSIATTNTHPHAHEICVIARQEEIVEVINKLCKILNEQCDVRVDKSCGLHVHLDMRNRNYELSFSNLVSMQNILYRMVPASRKSGTYCRPTRGKTWRVMDDRYHGINSAAYRRHRTIEVRIHSGTTDANKINNWIGLLVKTVEATEIKRAPTTAKGAQKMLNLSDELTAYVDARLEKFKNQHNKSEALPENYDENAA